MGRVSVSMAGGLMCAAKGAALAASALGKAALLTTFPALGLPTAIVAGMIGGMAGYFAGSKMGDTVYSAAKKAAGAAVSIGRAAWSGMKKTARGIKKAAKGVAGKLFH